MLKAIWLVMLILGIVLLFIDIILMVVLRLAHLMGELNGTNARRQVEKLKKININTNTTGNLIINSETAEEEIPIKDFDLSKVVPIENARVKENNVPLPDNPDSTSYMDVLDNTSYMDEGDKTSFMDDLGDLDSTTYMEDTLSKIENHVVILITEQTSLEIS